MDIVGDLLRSMGVLNEGAFLHMLFTKAGIFLLVLFRVLGIMMLAPVFGSRFIPARLRIGFAFLVALILWRTLPAQEPDLLTGLGSFVQAAILETAIGVILGTGASMIFVGLQLCGTIIGFQMGIALANVIDPVNNTQVSIIGNFYFYFGLFIFLVVDGHILVLKAIADSFLVIPLLGAQLEYDIVALVWNMLQYSFALGIRIAAPVMITLFITEVGMGFINRTVPQIHLLTAGFPVRLLIGFFVLAISLPSAAYFLDDVFINLGLQLQAFNDAMSPVKP
jgi:flagellar biosynthetic protein FliR